MSLLGTNDIHLRIDVIEDGDRIDIENLDSGHGVHLKGVPNDPKKIAAFITDFLIDLNGLEQTFSLSENFN